MSTTPASGGLQIGDAFGFVFRSPNWFGRLLVGGLCLLFGFLIIPGLILYGYTIEIGRNVSQGKSELPPWSGIGKKLGDGFLAAVALIVWGIPIWILYGIGFAVGGCSTQASTTTCTNSGGEVLFFSLAGLVTILYALLVPAIFAQYIEGGIGATMQFGTVFSRGTRHIGASIIVVIMGIIAAILSLLGIIAIFVGLLVTIPWAYYVQGNLYGQFARISRETAGAASSLRTT